MQALSKKRLFRLVVIYSVMLSVILAPLYVPVQPAAAAPNPNGTAGTAFITSYNTGAIDVIDLTTNQVELGKYHVNDVPGATMGSATPTTAGFNPNGKQVFVSVPFQQRVIVIDTSGNDAPPASVAVGSSPYGVAFSPDGLFAYIANNGDHTLSIVNTANLSATPATLPLPAGCSPVALASAGTGMYVTCSNLSTVVTFDISAPQAQTSIELYIGGTPPAAGAKPHGLSASVDGSKVYVALQGTSEVAVIDTATNTLETLVSVPYDPEYDQYTAIMGAGTVSTEVSPDDSLVYVANIYANSVSVIRTDTNSVIKTIQLPGTKQPYALGVSKDGNFVYTVNFAESSVSVIDVSDLDHAAAAEPPIYVSNGPYMIGTFMMPVAVAVNSEHMPPSPPTLDSKTAGDSEVSFTWTDVVGADQYKLYVTQTEGSFGSAAATVNAATPGDTVTGAVYVNYSDSVYTATIKGLDNGTAYYFAVTSVNSDGESLKHNVFQATPAGTLPAAPTLHTLSALSGAVFLTWTDVPGADEYKLYVSQTSGDFGAEEAVISPSQTGDIAANVHVTYMGNVYTAAITGLANGTTYYFAVTSVNSGGESDKANEVSATPVPFTPPPVAPILHTPVAFSGAVSLTWMDIPGVDEYKLYVSQTPGDFGLEKAVISPSQTGNVAANVQATHAGNIYTATITGLTNGTTYYFAVTSVNADGESGKTNEVSATPVPFTLPPVAPTLQTPVALSGAVSLTWANVPGVDEYKLYVSQTQGDFGAEEAVISPSQTGNVAANVQVTYASNIYTATITGLTNGTTYYFAVTSVNGNGESGKTNEVPAVPAPMLPPVTPTLQTPTAGNKQITIRWPNVAGADEYNLYVSGTSGTYGAAEATISSSQLGNVTANVQASLSGGVYSATIKGLTNGRTYYFAVTSVNQSGESGKTNEISAAPRASTGSDSNSDSGSAAAVEPPVNVIINGKPQNLGKLAQETRNGQSVTTVKVDQDGLKAKLAEEGVGAVVTIPVAAQSDVMIGELTADMVQLMEQQQAVLTLESDKAKYTLPAAQINVAALAAAFGEGVSLQDIAVRIEIAELDGQQTAHTDDALAAQGFTPVVRPLQFSIRGVYDGRTEEITKFDAYVERLIPLPEGVDPSKITTAVVVEPDGSLRHVPTEVTMIEGLYYAKVNSLTNSIYTIIWNPTEYEDAAAHWGRDAVNNIGSRLIMDSMDERTFAPDRTLTRAEFTEALVRALGLKPERGDAAFADAGTSDAYIQTAYAYGLISGYEDSSFRPTEAITRQEAMTMIAQAMKVTGLHGKRAAGTDAAAVHEFADSRDVSPWAINYIVECLQAGIVTGRRGDVLAPLAAATRAEAAVLIQALLRQSTLID